MSILVDFSYHKPKALDEALGLLSRFNGRARLLAGGTDLVCGLRGEQPDLEAVIDLKGLPGLDGITQVDQVLRIGALATFTELAESPLVRQHAPLLVDAALQMGSMGIRNRATLVGNLCSAVPCCDGAPPLLAMDGRLLLAGPSGRRSLPIHDWFLGPRRTALQSGELVLGLEVPLLGAQGAAYVKLGRTCGQDLAQVAVALLALPGGTFRVSFGAVAPRPLRGVRTEQLLSGGPRDAQHLASVAQVAREEVSPIDDVRASKAYRLHMTGVMVQRAVAVALERLEGRGPALGTTLI